MAASFPGASLLSVVPGEGVAISHELILSNIILPCGNFRVPAIALLPACAPHMPCAQDAQFQYQCQRGDARHSRFPALSPSEINAFEVRVSGAHLLCQGRASNMCIDKVTQNPS